MARAHLAKVMVVDDDPVLRSTLVESFCDGKTEVVACEDARSALSALEDSTPDVVLLDVSLPDGDAFDVLRAIHARSPTPAVVAISGTATPLQSFRLGELGVRTYVSKPFGMAEIRDAIDRAIAEPPDLVPRIRIAVGQRPLRDVEEELRATMLDEALARSGGSKRGAARLLHVSRQVIQYMIRRFRR